jgi:hypothetical protein
MDGESVHSGTLDGVQLPCDEKVFAVEFGRALQEREEKRAKRRQNKARRGGLK